MARRIRWQIALALLGTLGIFGITGSAALGSAAGMLPAAGAYVEGVVDAPTQLNPLVQTADMPQSNRDLTRLLFDGLTRHGSDGQPQPALAENWAISTSNLVYTFTLRSGLRWHDGVPLTVDDVVWTINSIKSPGFPGDKSLGMLWHNVRVAAVDDRTIRYILDAPFAPFLLATDVPILPVHLLRDVPLERWASDPFSRRPIGSGPFRLEQLDATQAVLRPFEGAVRGRPSIELLVLRFYPTLGAANEALRRRDVQGVASVATPGERAGTARRGLQTITTDLDQYTILTFNSAEGFLHDERLRRVLGESLDRDAIIARLLPGAARRLDTPILPGSWAARPDASLPVYDPAAAESHLQAAGWRRDHNNAWQQNSEILAFPLLTASTPSQRLLANEVAQQWRRIGIQVTIDAVPPAELVQRLQAHNFTIALHSWTDVGSDPDLFGLWHSSQIETGANYGGLADDELDRLLEAGRAANSIAERQRIYADVQRRWVALIPALPLFESQLQFSHDSDIIPNGLQGRLLQGNDDRFASISDWAVSTTP